MLAVGLFAPATLWADPPQESAAAGTRVATIETTGEESGGSGQPDSAGGSTPQSANPGTSGGEDTVSVDPMTGLPQLGLPATGMPAPTGPAMGGPAIGAAADGAGETPAIPVEGRKKLFVVEDQAAFAAQVCQQIEASAAAAGIPAGFLAKLIWKESWFDPNAISPKGAEGIAQFMPSTAARWGLENSFDPMAAISASATLLGHLYNAYGNLGLAAAAYNAGEGRVDSWRLGRSGLPAETRGYVASITGHEADAWKRDKPPEESFKLDETRPFQIACTEMPVYKAPLQRHFANTYYNRGLRLADKESYEDAIVRYSVAIRLKPDFPDAYNNRGIVYRKMGDYESAIANYDVAIRLKPTYAAAYNNRGFAYSKLGRYEEAVADYDKAIKLQPGYVAALFNRGFAHAQLRQFKEAVADYTSVLKKEPKQTLAHYNRALAYLELGNTKAARHDLDSAIATNGSFAKAYYRRAMLLHALGDIGRARKDYQKSVSLDERFGAARYSKLFD